MTIQVVETTTKKGGLPNMVVASRDAGARPCVATRACVCVCVCHCASVPWTGAAVLARTPVVWPAGQPPQQRERERGGGRTAVLVRVCSAEKRVRAVRRGPTTRLARRDGRKESGRDAGRRGNPALYCSYCSYDLGVCLSIFFLFKKNPLRVLSNRPTLCVLYFESCYMYTPFVQKKSVVLGFRATSLTRNMCNICVSK